MKPAPMNSSKKSIIQSSVGFHQILEDNIVLISLNKGVKYGVSELYESREINEKLFPEGSYGVLLESAGYVNFESEARMLSVTPEHTKGRFALAIINNSLTINALIKFYIMVASPDCPTKSFLSKPEALDWLRMQRR